MQLTRLGPFALESPLDRTKTQNVLRGVHVERQLSAAIKLLPRSVAKAALGASSFAADVKRLQQLDHPNIVRVYGGAVEQGQPYLVLELVEGESLQQLIDRRGKLPWEMAIEIVDAVTEALIYAHNKGFVHQRITPDRILLPTAGGVKLTGFDCKWADHDAVVASQCPMQVAHYLSPEQFRGRQSAEYPQCDLYSLGVVLYECLTGEVPWLVNTPDRLRQARRDGPAPKISTKVLDCPMWIDPLVEKLLAKIRSERWQSAEEVHHAIVIAKQKANAGVGAAQHAWSGKTSSLQLDCDPSELRAIQRRPPRQRDDSPFYERAWFLALCLAALVGVGAWVMWPASEEALFAKAKPLMESGDPVDWKRAQEQYLTPLIERFPDSTHQTEINAFNDRYAMHRAEERIKNLARFGRSPKSEAERSFAEAWEFERFGDRLTAWQKYEALIRLFADSQDPDEQVYAKLAKRHIERFKAEPDSSATQITFLQQHLQQAEAHRDAGRLLEARKILDSVISLYAGNQELRPQVEQARQLLEQLDTQVAP